MSIHTLILFAELLKSMPVAWSKVMPYLEGKDIIDVSYGARKYTLTLSDMSILTMERNGNGVLITMPNKEIIMSIARNLI